MKDTAKSARDGHDSPGPVVAVTKIHGTEKALAEYYCTDGSFRQGELYTYACISNGTTLANPVNPESAGEPSKGRAAVLSGR